MNGTHSPSKLELEGDRGSDHYRLIHNSRGHLRTLVKDPISKHKGIVLKETMSYSRKARQTDSNKVEQSAQCPRSCFIVCMLAHSSLSSCIKSTYTSPFQSPSTITVQSSPSPTNQPTEPILTQRLHTSPNNPTTSTHQSVGRSNGNHTEMVRLRRQHPKARHDRGRRKAAPGAQSARAANHGSAR